MVDVFNNSNVSFHNVCNVFKVIIILVRLVKLDIDYKLYVLITLQQDIFVERSVLEMVVVVMIQNVYNVLKEHLYVRFVLMDINP